MKEGSSLSPTLFVFYYSVLLSELKEQLPAASVYAYMDDMALVVKDLQEARAALQAIHNIGCKLGFLINAKKTKVHHWRSQPRVASLELPWGYTPDPTNSRPLPGPSGGSSICEAFCGARYPTDRHGKSQQL